MVGIVYDASFIIEACCSAQTALHYVVLSNGKICTAENMSEFPI